MNEYQSSEELQRTNRDTFIDASTKRDAQERRSEKDNLHKVLDKYIAKHSSTKDVRSIAKELNRTADHQLNLSADIVEILETIKNELR